MTEKRFTDVWCSKTGDIGLTDDGVDLTFKGDSFEQFLNDLNEERRTNLYDFNMKVHECNLLKKENEQLKSEINMLKITISRNESYIKRITEQGEWRK